MKKQICCAVIAVCLGFSPAFAQESQGEPSTSDSKQTARQGQARQQRSDDRPTRDQRQPRQRERRGRDNSAPAPHLTGVSYGPHDAQVMDLWLAKSDTPTPLVIFIHGGGFRGGSRKAVKMLDVEQLLEAGVSCASLDYRLSGMAPFPAPFEDCARAVQFLRLNADKYNLDSTRFGGTGGSAGAGLSQWLAFHDDMAEPQSDEPIKRQSTKLQVVAVFNGQTSYDPLWIREHIGGNAWQHPALQQLFNVTPEAFETEQAQVMFNQASPIHHLTADDPPTYHTYSGMREGDIHSGRFGVILKEKMDQLGIECVVMIGGKPVDEKTAPIKLTDFLIKHLQAG